MVVLEQWKREVGRIVVDEKPVGMLERMILKWEVGRVLRQLITQVRNRMENGFEQGSQPVTVAAER